MFSKLIGIIILASIAYMLWRLWLLGRRPRVIPKKEPYRLDINYVCKPSNPLSMEEIPEEVQRRLEAQRLVNSVDNVGRSVRTVGFIGLLALMSGG